jgi:hypothetical protein
MTTIDAERLGLLASEYKRKGYAVIPGLVDPEVASEWELRYRALPGKKAHVGGPDQPHWIEQWVSDPARALDGLAFADGFIDLVAKVAGLHAIDRNRSQVWLNRYSPGDRVATHCDREGSTQLVLCLQGLLEPDKGGDLMIADEAIQLRTGDAVLFFACGILHGVQPIESTQVGSSGFSRVTCVIRLFAANAPEGAFQ